MVTMLAAGFTFALMAQGPGPAMRSDIAPIVRAVDSLAAVAVRDRLTPALGIAVAVDGRVVHAKSHGMADVSAGIAAGDRTLWYVASTSKSFTGFGISLLAQRGVVRLEDPISTLLPGVRWHAGVRPDQLTLAHFLSHTHNLNDNAVVSSAAFTGAIPEARWPDLVVLATPTGANELVYSNFGYNVAAMVIDGKRPEGWRRYLEKEVYEPAGLRETYARVSGIDPSRIARPHRLNADGSFTTAPFQKTDATMNSAGGHLSTLNDLARWTIVQMDSGRIDGQQVFAKDAVTLSHRLIARQTRPQSGQFAYFSREGWGAGWDIGTYEGERMVSRFGGYHSTRSHVGFLPRRRIGVVVMTTGGVGSPLADVVAAFAYDLDSGRRDARSRAAERMGELRTRLTAARRLTATSDSARAARQREALRRPLSDFTGRFSEPAFGEVAFTVRDGRLEYRWGVLHGPVEILDASRDQLRIEIAGTGNAVSFRFSGPGPAQSIDLQGVTFTRIP